MQSHLADYGQKVLQRQTCCAWLQGLPGCLPWGMFLTFFNDFLSQQKGLSVPVATMVRCDVNAGCRLTLLSPSIAAWHQPVRHPVKLRKPVVGR